MLLKLYDVKDTITGEFLGILPARNEADFRRLAKNLLAAKQGNAILVENYKDKQIFLVGEKDTLTGVVVGEVSPVFVCTVQELVEELLEDAKRAKANYGTSEEGSDAN